MASPTAHGGYTPASAAPRLRRRPRTEEARPAIEAFTRLPPELAWVQATIVAGSLGVGLYLFWAG